MKHLLVLFFSFCLIFSSIFTTEAKAPDTCTTAYIEYINNDFYAEVELSVTDKNHTPLSTDNSLYSTRAARASTYQKTASKTYKIKNRAGATVASYTLTGTFVYNGSSSTCTKASYSTSIYNSIYSFVSKSAYRSGNTAIGSFKISSSIQTISKTLSLKCSASGTIQ